MTALITHPSVRVIFRLAVVDVGDVQVLLLCTFHLIGCSWVLRSVSCIRHTTQVLQHV